jgi:uncharacterized protein (DUF488 family)
MSTRSCALYTIGHSNRPIEALLETLHEAGIGRVVDVRALPRSRRWPQYGRAALARSLAVHGIDYEWSGETLGGFRAPRPGSPNVALAGAFRGFADHMATREFALAIEVLLAEAARTPTAILCAERLPRDCHRSLIADYVLARGTEVVHLLAPGSRAAARLNPAARVVAEGLVYDAGGQAEML